MISFSNYESFLNDLIESIETRKDVYVFNYSFDTDTDYQRMEQEKSIDYYVTVGLDIVELQTKLFFMLVYGKDTDLIITLDWVYDESPDGEQVAYKRLFIFREVK